MSDNSVKNFFSRAWEFIKRIAKIVGNYLKVAKMEWIVMIGLFALDLISKTVVEKTLGYHNELTLIPNFLAIELIPNYNAAYGADFISNWLGTMGARIFFSVFAVAASVAFILVLIRNKGKNKLFRVAIAMFVAGAMGNCIDRMCIGWVRDFVHFTFQPYIFNIADAELVFGVVLIVIYFLFLYRDGDKRKEQPTAPLVDDLGEIDPVDMTAQPEQTTNADEKQNGKANAGGESGGADIPTSVTPVDAAEQAENDDSPVDGEAETASGIGQADDVSSDESVAQADPEKPEKASTTKSGVAAKKRSAKAKVERAVDESAAETEKDIK